MPSKSPAPLDVRQPSLEPLSNAMRKQKATAAAVRRKKAKPDPGALGSG